MSATPLAARPPAASSALARVLGRADLVLFSLSAILTIDTLASAASVGVSWFAWWAVTLVVFFVPYALMSAELGSAWPQEGGLYVWVREGLGARAGSLAAWFYWINNAYWMPSVYLVFAATFRQIFLDAETVERLAARGLVTWLDAGVAILLTWITVAIGVVRLGISKWVPNLGAVVKVAIFVALGALGFAWLAQGRAPANDFSLGQLAPRLSDSLVFLPVLLYNALGFELVSGAGGEMKDPQRDVPRAVLLTGALVAAVYALGVLGILLAVPLERLSLVTGTWDALLALGEGSGSTAHGLVLLLGLGFLYACVANIVTWSLGTNRVAAAAAAEGSLPSALGRLHPRHGTPHVAFAVTGALSTALLVGNAGFAASSDNAFWLIFKLSSLCFLFTYLLVFPAFALLRVRRPEVPRPYRMPGGDRAGIAAAVCCTAVVAVACALFFRPAPNADLAAAARENALLAAECLATLAVGLFLLPRGRRPPAAIATTEEV
ncbi:MAG: APC family permease [Vicinamibacteria bacterium]